MFTVGNTPIRIRHQGSYPVLKGLLGYWAFNECGGNIVRDLTKHGRHATFHNSTAWHQGKDGRDVVFASGSSDYADGTTLGSKGGSGITICVRFWSTTSQASKCLLSIPLSSGGSNGCDLSWNSDTSLTGGACWSTGGYIQASTLTVPSMTTGRLRFAAMSAGLIDGKSHMFCDGLTGTSSGSGSGTINGAANEEFNIGRFGSFGAYYSGHIVEAMVFNRGLTNAELTDIWLRPYSYLQPYRNQWFEYKASGRSWGSILYNPNP